jgi:hypothetical protein
MMSLILTLIALAAAAISVAVALKVVQQERARSAARVVALASAIDPSTDDTFDNLFASENERPHNPQPPAVAKMGIGMGAVAAAIVLVVAVSVGIGSVLRGWNAPATTEASASGSPLTLLSMRHERNANSLTVTGLVRNDADTRTDSLVAVVFAFDKAGSFVASARAPIDLGALAPGDESPFRVAISNVPDVGRYRVSFRTDAGLVRHVDRRAGNAQSIRAVSNTASNQPIRFEEQP